MQSFAEIEQLLSDFIKTRDGNPLLFENLSTKLSNLESSILSPSFFNDYSTKIDLKNAKNPKKITIRGKSLDVSDAEYQRAILLQHILKIDYKQLLYIDSKNKDLLTIAEKNPQKENEKNVILTLASIAYNERNNFWKIILSLLQETSYPVFGDKFFQFINTNIDQIYKNIIEYLKLLFQNYQNIEENLQLSEQLTAQQLSELIELKKNNDLITIINILKILSLLLLNFTPNQSTSLWFSINNDFETFFSTSDKEYKPNSKSIKNIIFSLITVNGLIALGLDITHMSINTNISYFNDFKLFEELQNMLVKYNNPILLFHWSFILFTKSCLIEENDSNIQSFDKSTLNINSIKFASLAESLNFVDTLNLLSISLQDDSFYSVIIAAFLNFSLNFIPLTIDISMIIRNLLLKVPIEFVYKFLTTDIFDKKIEILKTKLPLIDESLLPLINITSCNVEFADYVWNRVNTYMVKIKLSELSYDIYEESLSLDLIVLKEELLVDIPLNSDSITKMPIPKGTKGKIIPTNTDTNEELIIFSMEYNGWSMLGHIFQNIFKSYVEKNESLSQVNEHTLIALIKLITIIGSTSISSTKSDDIVNQLSMFVDENDIFSIYFKLFEHALHKRKYNILEIFMENFTTLFTKYSKQIWLYLEDSELLTRRGKNGLVTSILGSLEIPSGQYKFTIELVKFARLLIIDAIENDTENSFAKRSEIIQKLTRHILHIYESYQYWVYYSIQQRYELNYYLTSFIKDVLYFTHGIGYGNSPDKKFSKILQDASESIIETFLASQSPDVQAVKVLCTIVLSSNETSNQLIYVQNIGNTYKEGITATYQLIKLLIFIRGELNLSSSILEKQLFSISSDLVEVYYRNPIWKANLIQLFEIMISTPWTDDYPLLLSYLRKDWSILFLNSLSSDLESNITDYKLLKRIYSFFSSLMNTRQDGLALLLLTGSIMEGKSENSPVGGSLLEKLKDNALNLDKLPDDIACTLLTALASSLNSWTQLKATDVDKKLIDILLNKLKEFKSVDDHEHLSFQERVDLAKKYELISKVLELLSLYLFSFSDISSKIYEYIGQPEFPTLSKMFFSIHACDGELQKQLSVDFEQKWPHLQLAMFNTSPLLGEIFGNEHLYFDFNMLDKVIQDKTVWYGSTEMIGLRDRILSISSDIELTQQQIAAAKALGALITSYIERTPKKLEASFISVAINLSDIDMNIDKIPDILKHVYRERLELCFFILYSFQQNKTPVLEKDIIPILCQLMSTLKSDSTTFLSNISESSASNFYCPIFRSILILLSISDSYKTLTEKHSDDLIDFCELAFCKGVNLIFSSILSEISKPNTNDNPNVITNMAEKLQDLFLLLSLFAKIKQINTNDEFKITLANSLDQVGTLKVLLNFYSSVHLFKINNDIVFAPLVLSFISELCTVKQIAEKFVSNGLFAVLLESPISVAIQQGNIKPESHPALHNIWRNGLLPICLIMVSEFENQYLSECCLFVSFFSKQIRSTIYSWFDPNILVSNSLITETSQLILLQKIFEALNYKQFLSTSGHGRSNDTIELVVGLDSDDDRARLYTTLNRLLVHPKYLNSRIIASDMDEQHKLDSEVTRGDFVNDISEKIRKFQGSLVN